MRHVAFGALLLASLPLFAQPRQRPMRPMSMFADNAETAVKQAVEAFTALKKICDRDIEVLQHIRTADAALVDPMQPSNAVQKALDEVAAAKQLEEDVRIGPREFTVYQGILKTLSELENAKLSPMTADFGHLRAVVRDNALGPAARVSVRDATALQGESIAWIRVQQLISDHIRALSEETGAVLRSSEQQ